MEGFACMSRFRFPARCPQMQKTASPYFAKFGIADYVALQTSPSTDEDSRREIPVFEVGSTVRPRPAPHLLSEPRTIAIGPYRAMNLRASSSWSGLDRTPSEHGNLKEFIGREDMWRALLARNVEDAGQFADGVPLQMEASCDFHDWHCLDHRPEARVLNACQFRYQR